MKWWKWLYYKFFAKYNLQDTPRGFNGDVKHLSVFRPTTNPKPPNNWRGNRVEVEDRNPKNHKEGSVLQRDFSFTLLDSAFLNDVDYVGIQQLWSRGNPLPKYFAFIQKYKGKYYFKVRHATAEGKLIFSKHYEIKVGVEHQVNVLIKVSNSTGGHIFVAVGNKTIMDLNNCQTQDVEHPLLEKFGMYWNKDATITPFKYPDTIKITMNRNWLN